ncbi:MAG: biotin/lipoyl-containing protein, partial [Bacillota bacterium]|nr:biotin/lipoyl-containing protein [Bacillota bacterium]
MVEVKLHDIGEGMTEGEIIHYFVKVGDMVKVDQPLLEVQTDKMVAELPSPSSGKVKEIVVDHGNIVSVGTTLLVLETEKEKVVEPVVEKQMENVDFKQAVSITQPQQTAIAEQKNKKKFIIAAPYTRKIAREFQVDINEITGTGANGRITVKDIYEFVKKRDGFPSSEETKEISTKTIVEETESKQEIQ